MNIKEHIEAGRYPKGENAVIAVVPFAGPTGMGRVAHIVSTFGLGRYCLLGYYGHGHPYFAGSWDVDGNCHSEESSSPKQYALLPPPPRKVKVAAYMVIDGGGNIRALHRWDSDAEGDLRVAYPNGRVVTLTGEYEEPWS